jgi:1-aminocyclopropane-1-carboxylate deaminase
LTIFVQPNIQTLPFHPRLQALIKPKAVDVLRLDQIHPLVSGNKWYKLKHNLEAARKLGYQNLLSCGGPYSNHLHALACAGSALGFKTRALVRGYENAPLTATLLNCQEMGMELVYIDKKTYRKRYDAGWCQQQAESYGAYWIPEGGNNDLGRKGCSEIAQACQGYDEIWTSIGSGCTYLGLAQALQEDNRLDAIHLTGVMAIKGGQELAEALLDGLAQNRFSIDCEQHLGGFGRCPDKLVDLIKRYDKLALPLDPVYTAKLVMAFEQAWIHGQLDTEKRYLLIHSGGLQGRRGVSALSESLP